MSKHTPGPWKWGWDGTGLAGRRTSPTVYLDETDTAEIPIHARGQAVAWVLRSGAETADMKADARLIAAAPDMLEALHMALEAMNHMGDELNDTDAVGEADEKFFPAFRVVHAAIARAEGKD